MHSLLYITEDKTLYVCCLYTKIQIRKYDSCFWSKPCEGQNTLAVVTESSQKNTEGGRKSRVIVTLLTVSVCLYFTQDDREVDADSWVIQLNDSLRYKILLNPLQFSFLSAVLGHHSLLVKFMSQISIFIKIQGASPCKDKWCCILGAS